jgi:hypothetical protein
MIFMNSLKFRNNKFGTAKIQLRQFLSYVKNESFQTEHRGREP